MENYLSLLLLFIFHFNSHLTSSSPSSLNLDTPFLCNPRLSDALLQFKSTFTVETSASWWCDNVSGGRSYPKTESWKEGTDCCSSWDGVTCDEVTGDLIGLDLSCSQLVGTIYPNSTLFSSHIAPYLRRLNLAGNNFQGSNLVLEFGVKFWSSLTHLNLSSSVFGGNIPPEISLLSNLVSLDLAGSLFDGNIPLEISHLSNLVFLDLSYSGFSGNIPSEISHLTNLASLDLSYNLELIAESDRVLERIAQNLTHLRVLHLDMVDMSSLVHASSSLSNLSSSLSSLSLGGCQLQGEFPVSLLLRPNLQELSLPYNHFNPATSLPVYNSNTSSKNLAVLTLSDINLSSVSTSFLDFVGNLESLRSLDLDDCSLGGSLLPSFRNLTKLTRLSLSRNNLNGPIPASICNMTQLHYLSLADNLFTGPLPSCSFAMPALEFLLLDDNSLSGSFDFHMLLDLKKLRILHLSRNDLSSSTPTRNNLSYSLPSLEDVGLSSCNLTEFPSFLKTLPNLRSLNISNNKIQGPVPEWMFSKNSLTNTGMLHWKNIYSLDFHSNLLQGDLPIPPLSTVFLSVSDNNFTGEISSLICDLTSLEVLDLSHNRFSGLIPHCIGNLSTLSVLNLGMNNLHGNIPDMFARDNSLNSLNLNTNQLRGRLPNSLSYCQYLTVLDVGHNLIEGDIPEVIGKLSSLKGLNLSHNFLTGHIPPSMGDLDDLEWLDLSSNKLVGQIPRELTNLGSLAVLSLSHNRLEGLIPQGKQFDTFENDSYEENLGLCGFPLSRACKIDEEASSEKNVDSLDSASGFSWEGAFIRYGCAIVLFGMFMGYYLVFSSRSPQWLVRMFEGKRQHGKSVKRSKKNGHKRGGKRS